MPQVLDVYGRVSREGNRKDKPAYDSPSHQEERALAVIAARGASVGVVEIETDVSGFKPSTERGIEKLVQRCESGESNGIVVLDWTRFSREHPLNALGTLNRLVQAGACLLDGEGCDLADDKNFVIVAVRADDAYHARKRMVDRSLVAIEHAVEVGVHASRTPFGYRRKKGQRLQPDPNTAPLVYELYERRAAGESVTMLTRWLAAQGHDFSRSGVRDMLKNPTYLGQVRNGCGKWVNEHAHPALIDRDLFDRVQAVKGTPPVHTGTAASQCMLRSLLRCGACGSAMCATSTRGKQLADGTREKKPAYVCNGRASCSNKAYVSQADIDPYIDALVVSSFGDRDSESEARVANEHLSNVMRELADAQHEYDQLKSERFRSTTERRLGLEDYIEILANAKGRLDLVHLAYGEALNASQAIENFNGSMAAVWPALSVADKNAILRDMFDFIQVKPSNGKRNVPVENRIAIWKDDVLVNFSETDSQVTAVAI
jgi:DNA invertase Pin-like site-specific DNA recombinase